MSTASDRLASYLAAEQSILTELGQELRQNDRILVQGRLDFIQAAIKDLTAQVSAENAAAQGRFGPNVMVADFSGRCGRG